MKLSTCAIQKTHTGASAKKHFFTSVFGDAKKSIQTSSMMWKHYKIKT